MRLKTVLTVNCVYAFLFGVGFIFSPAQSSSLVGFTLAGDASLIARCMGIFVVCTGVLAYSARNSERSLARRAILLCFLTLYVFLIVFKVLLNVVWGFALNPMFAFLYLFHIALVTSYAYHLFGRPREIDT
jgi:hypothetical protein